MSEYDAIAADLSSDPPPFTARERLMKKTIEELTINWGKEVTALRAQLSAARAEAEQARGKAIEESSKVCDEYARDGRTDKEYACETADELAARIRVLSATTPKGGRNR